MSTKQSYLLLRPLSDSDIFERVMLGGKMVSHGGVMVCWDSERK